MSKKKKEAGGNVGRTEKVLHKALLGAVEPEGGFNYRTHIDKKGLELLAQSLSEVGMSTPMTVRPKRTESGEIIEGAFVITDGERRYLAAKMIWPDDMPIDILIEDESETDALLSNVIKNMREDVHPADLAVRLARLEEEGHPADLLGEKLALTKGYVYKLLRVVKGLSPSSLDFWRKENIPVSELLEIAKLDHEEQPVALEAWKKVHAEKPKNGHGKGKGKGGKGGGDDETTHAMQGKTEIRDRFEYYSGLDELSERQAGILATLKWVLGVTQSLR